MPETLVDVAQRGATFARRVYDEVLAGAFPPDELDDRDTFVASLFPGGEGVVALALADGEGADRPQAAIVGYEYRECGVLLIGYLAVRADRRSGGMGAALLDAARLRWCLPAWCQVALAEVEDPRYHAAGEQDPRRRLAFYQRHGATLLRRPYFQPRLRPGLARVGGMLLISLWRPPRATAPDGVPAEPVVSFLQQYFAESEGTALPDDRDLEALLGAYRSAPVIELVPLDDYRAVTQIGPLPPLLDG